MEIIQIEVPLKSPFLECDVSLHVCAEESACLEKWQDLSETAFF